MSRDDFSSKTIKLLAERVGYHCSNPNCDISTVGPSVNTAEKEYVGVAAHIYSASPSNGPRANPSLSVEQRKHYDNGIHLCNKCSTLIDKNNGRGYSAELLLSWKKDAEERAKKRLYQNRYLNKYYDEIFYTFFEREYSTALTCCGLNPQNVKSCPENSQYVTEASNKLKVAYKLVIKGDSGSGKSLLTYQIGYKFYLEGYKILKLLNSNINDVSEIILPGEKTLLIIDDSQSLPESILEKILRHSSDNFLILLNWNNSVNLGQEAIREYPSLNIDPKKIVELLTNYCKENKTSVSQKLIELDVEVNPKSHFKTIDYRIEQASREKTPWQFNYSLSEGWKSAAQDISILKNKQGMDELLAITAIYQIVTLDRGVSAEQILKSFNSNSTWTHEPEFPKKIIIEYCISNDGLVKLKHYEYAKRIIINYLKVNKGEPNKEDILISIIKSILEDSRYSDGHSNIINFILHDFKYCYHSLSTSGFFVELARSILSDETSTKGRINTISSLRFDKSIISIISRNKKNLGKWLLDINRETAYPLSHLVNDIYNNYKDFKVPNRILHRLYALIFNSRTILMDKSRYCSVINRLHLFTTEEQKDYLKKLLDTKRVIILLPSSSDEDIYFFSQILTQIGAYNDKWTSDNIVKNSEIIANLINSDFNENYWLFKDIIDHYFDLIALLLNTKYRHKYTKSTALAIIDKVDVSKIVDAFSRTKYTDVQRYWNFLLFISHYSDEKIQQISNKFDYNLLKVLYEDDRYVTHDHICLLKILYNSDNPKFTAYIDYVISKFDVLPAIFYYFHPEEIYKAIKEGTKLQFDRLTFKDDYKNIRALLSYFYQDGKESLVPDLIIRNKDEIMEQIFTASTNIDDNNEKYEFLIFIYNKYREVLEDIFISSQKMEELLKKSKRLIKGKKAEKNMARLYIYFILEFTTEYTSEIQLLGKKYKSLFNISIKNENNYIVNTNDINRNR